MFVEVAVPVPMPVAAAHDRLLTLLGDDAGLRDSAEGGFRDGQAVLLHAGFAGVTQDVEVRSVPAYRRGTTTVVMVRWEATGPMAGLIPPLDADLELDTDEDGTCTLTLRGSYRPLLGAPGAVLDRLILQRSAYAAVQGFLTRLARVILAPLGPDPLPEPELADAEAGIWPGRVVDEGSLFEVLAAGCRRAVRLLEDARWAGVTAWFAGEPCTVAPTDPVVVLVDRAQYAQGDGPALVAIRTDHRVAGTVQGMQDRWPRWARTAAAAGVRSFLAEPLHTGEHPVGSLNLYSPRSGGVRDPEPMQLTVLTDILDRALVDYRATRPATEPAARVQAILRNHWDRLHPAGLP